MKKQDRVGGTGEKAESKKPKASVVAFPWKWVGVGAVALIIILSVIVLRPQLSGGGSTNPNVPEECIEGKTLTIDFDVSLHIFITDDHRVNYTQLIPNGIGTDPVDGQTCTRQLHTGNDYNTSYQAARIHVQSPNDWNFTLGDFFVMWNNQTLGPDKVLSFWLSSGWRIVFKVNGAILADTDTNPGYHYETFRLIPDQDIVFYVSHP